MTTEHIATSARIESSTLDEFIKEKTEPIFRKAFLLGAMKAYGRFSFNHGGKAMQWRPRFRRRTITAGEANPSNITFTRYNTKKSVSLPWRKYDMGETITKFEKLVNQGEAAWFNLVEDVVTEMLDDFTEDFRLRLYFDGNATGTPKDIHGLESIYSVNGLVAGSRIGDPDDSYAGQDTDLGALGDWSGTFPDGTGDTEYHWWAPIVVDYQNAGWTPATKSWYYTWREAIRYAAAYLAKLQNVQVGVCLLDTTMLNDCKNSLDSSERFLVDQNSKLRQLGFPTLMFEDIEFASEYGCTADVGYLLPKNFEHIEFRSMQDQLIVKDNDDDITTSTELLLLDCYGNLRIDSPAFMGKLEAITALGT